MKKMLLVLAACAVAALPALQASAQLANPGFEDPILDGAFAGNWGRFAGGPATATQDSVDPRSGAKHMIFEAAGADSYAGIAQDLALPIGPGSIVKFSGWHKALFPSNATREVKFEWVGAPQTRIDSTVVGDTYSQWSETAVAPIGATGVRLAYVISTFGSGPEAKVYLDDIVATVVPEPATAGLLGAGLLGLLGLRRRK